MVEQVAGCGFVERAVSDSVEEAEVVEDAGLLFEVAIAGMGLDVDDVTVDVVGELEDL